MALHTQHSTNLPFIFANLSLLAIIANAPSPPEKPIKMIKDSLSKLVERMRGNDSTRGWDVVVSYDEDKVNDLLRNNPIAELEKFPKFDGTSRVKRKGKFVDLKYEFELQLPKPRLALEEHGRVSLTADMEGTFKQTAPEAEAGTQQSIPPGYQLAISAYLLGVDGREDGKPTAPAVGVNSVVDLGSDLNASRKICLSFKDAEASILGKAKNPDVDFDATEKEALRDGLSANLAKSLKDHFICGVGRQGADASLIILKPRSFVFTVQKRDDVNNNPGTLIMWIAVEGGDNNGKRPTGTTELIFEPDGNSACPIPDNCSASILFSHGLMAAQYFKPNLEKFMKEVKVTATKGEAGMIITGKLQSGAIKVKEFNETWGPFNVKKYHYCSGLEFKTDNNLSVITIKPDIANTLTDAVVLEYKSGPQKSKWTTTTVQYYGKGRGWRREGAVNFEFSWTSKGQWKLGQDSGTNPNSLQLVFTGDEKFSMTVKADDTERGFLEKMFGLEAGIPVGYDKVEVPKMDVKVEMKALDYFLTTNLLFPGKHVFHAHELTQANKDKGMGIAFPRDLILTGDIKI